MFPLFCWLHCLTVSLPGFLWLMITEIDELPKWKIYRSRWSTEVRPDCRTICYTSCTTVHHAIIRLCPHVYIETYPFVYEIECTNRMVTVTNGLINKVHAPRHVMSGWTIVQKKKTWMLSAASRAVVPGDGDFVPQQAYHLPRFPALMIRIRVLNLTVTLTRAKKNLRTWNLLGRTNLAAGQKAGEETTKNITRVFSM